MNEPTASAEWTAEHVASFIHESYESPGHKSLQAIADAHNAALSVEREKVAQLEQQVSDGYHILREQLAAERAKVKLLEEELNEAVKILKLEDIDAAIRKVSRK